MGKRRFPSVKYRNQIASETEDEIEDCDLELHYAGNAGKEMDWLKLMDSDGNTLIHLQMNSDERFKEDRANYVLCQGERVASNVEAEYQQFDHAKAKWFDMLDNYTPDEPSEEDLDSGTNAELTDF